MLAAEAAHRPGHGGFRWWRSRRLVAAAAGASGLEQRRVKRRRRGGGLATAEPAQKRRSQAIAAAIGAEATTAASSWVSGGGGSLWQRDKRRLGARPSRRRRRLEVRLAARQRRAAHTRIRQGCGRGGAQGREAETAPGARQLKAEAAGAEHAAAGGGDPTGARRWRRPRRLRVETAKAAVPIPCAVAGAPQGTATKTSSRGGSWLKKRQNPAGQRCVRDGGTGGSPWRLGR